MRRPLVLGACVLALGGCGGGSSGDDDGGDTVALPKPALVTPGLQPPAGCYVTVFLIEEATKAQIQQVQDVLQHNRGVAQIAFVSRGLALERFTRKHPNQAKGIHVNPFSDQFEVIPRTHGAVFAIITEFATNGGPITNVTASDGCNQPD